MSYINIRVPFFPYFAYSGNALYRPGDKHRARRNLPFFDLLFVEYGHLFMGIENEVYELNRGSILIIPPNVYHYGTRICTQKTFFHWLHFRADHFSIDPTPNRNDPPKTRVIAPVTDAISYLSIPIEQRLPEHLLENAFEIVSVLETRNIDFYSRHDRIISSDIRLLSQQELFLRFLGMISLQPEQSAVSEIAFTILQYLNTHYAEEFTIERMASIVNCHPTHLIRCVKKEYGRPPMQLLIQIRIKRACELLVASDNSITDIAGTVGFSSPSYFCKQFKKINGCSPNEYRKTAQHSGIYPSLWADEMDSEI